MDRFEKLEWLLETCSSDFIQDCPFLQALVRSMSEKEFGECYDYICRVWEIAKTPEELDALMNA